MIELGRIDAEGADLQSGIAAAQDEITRLRIRIAHMKTRLSLLRIRRNALVPFSRLPSDVVSHIIAFLVRIDHIPFVKDASMMSLSQLQNPFGKRAAWISILGVCTNVRALAINTPLLWSFIDLDARPEWIRLCIARASTSPLLVATATPAQQYTDKIISWREQIKTLYLGAERFNDAGMIYASDMPSLRAAYFTGQHSRSPVPFPFVIHSTFLRGASSCLTRLVINRARFVAAPSFPNLSYLDLCQIDCDANPDHVLDFVEKSPALEELYINDVMCNPSAQAVPRQALKLANLARLGISGDLPFIAIVLPKLRVPPHGYCMVNYHHIWMEGSVEVERRAWCERAFHAALQVFGHGGMWPAVHLSAKVHNSEAYRLCLWIEHAESTDLTMTYEDQAFSLSDFHPIIERSHTLDVHGVIAEFSGLVCDHSFPLTRLEHLVIEDGETADLTAIHAWLYRRASMGQPLGILEFRRCARVHRYAGAFTSLVEFLRSLERDGVVITILLDGHAIMSVLA
jgi:hypothetical protein